MPRTYEGCCPLCEAKFDFAWPKRKYPEPVMCKYCAGVIWQLSDSTHRAMTVKEMRELRARGLKPHPDRVAERDHIFSRMWG
jgi:hypothetical protein